MSTVIICEERCRLYGPCDDRKACDTASRCVSTPQWFLDALDRDPSKEEK